MRAFSREIVEAQPLMKFKIWLLDLYKGKHGSSWPYHLLRSITLLLNIIGAIRWWCFFVTFKKSPLRWISNLPLKSIVSFVEFKKNDVTQFASAQKHLKNYQTLLKMRHEWDESFKIFIVHFQLDILEVKDLKRMTP